MPASLATMAQFMCDCPQSPRGRDACSWATSHRMSEARGHTRLLPSKKLSGKPSPSIKVTFYLAVTKSGSYLNESACANHSSRY